MASPAWLSPILLLFNSSDISSFTRKRERDSDIALDQQGYLVSHQRFVEIFEGSCDCVRICELLASVCKMNGSKSEGSAFAYSFNRITSLARARSGSSRVAGGVGRRSWRSFSRITRTDHSARCRAGRGKLSAHRRRSGRTNSAQKLWCRRFKFVASL